MPFTDKISKLIPQVMDKTGLSKREIAIKLRVSDRALNFWIAGQRIPKTQMSQDAVLQKLHDMIGSKFAPQADCLADFCRELMHSIKNADSGPGRLALETLWPGRSSEILRHLQAHGIIHRQATAGLKKYRHLAA